MTDPLTSLVLGTAIGAPTAFVPHAANAAVRAASTTVTGGVANPLLSVLEDAISIVIFVLAVLVPLVVVAAVGFTLYLTSRWLRPPRATALSA